MGITPQLTRMDCDLRGHKKESVFYVYAHLCARTGGAFYIGKGSGKRAWQSSGRSSLWRSISSEFGYSVFILCENMIESDSLELETFLISELKLRGGRVANQQLVGYGVSGFKPSKETKQKQRERKLGKKQSPEHAAKSAMSRKGHKNTPEAIEATMRARRRPVIASDGTWYESATAAGRAMQKKNGGATLQGNITSALNGKRKTAHGLSWSYEI